MNFEENTSSAAALGAPAALGSETARRIGRDTRLEAISGSERRAGRLSSLAVYSLLVSILTPLVVLTREKFQKILLAVVVLDISFQFGTHLFYDERVEEYGAMGGLGISSTTIALTCLYVSWFFRSLRKRDRQEDQPLHISWSLLIYLLIIIASVFVAQNTSLAWFEACLFWQSFLVYVYVANCVRTREDVSFIVNVLLAGALVESVFMVILSFTGMPSTLWGLPTHIHVEPGEQSSVMRVGGTVGGPNTAASYLSFLLSCSFAVFFATLKKMQKMLAVAVLCVGGAALVVTFSRGGWLALLISLSVFCFVAARQRRFSLKAPLAVVVILALLYLPFHNVVSARLLGDDKGSAESRIPLMNLAWRIFLDNPVLGVGANNFSVAMDRYLTPEFRHGFLFAVHNKYLLVLCETGIGGLAAFLVFLFAALRRGWQCWKLQDRFLSPLALGFVAGIIGHMVHMNVDVFRGQPIQQLLWLIAGLFVAMHRIGAESESLSLSPQP